jgi:hypothetical protein
LVAVNRIKDIIRKEKIDIKAFIKLGIFMYSKALKRPPQVVLIALGKKERLATKIRNFSCSSSYAAKAATFIMKKATTEKRRRRKQQLKK